MVNIQNHEHLPEEEFVPDWCHKLASPDYVF